MAKYSGKVGFGEEVETRPGVWEKVIIEKIYFGEVDRNIRSNALGEQVNEDLSVNNQISIVADAYASEHFFAIKYVEWAGKRWTVPTVEVRRPRLILQIGEVYNGPLPA